MKLFFNLVSAVVGVSLSSLIPLPAARVASAAPVSAPVAALLLRLQRSSLLPWATMATTPPMTSRSLI